MTKEQLRIHKQKFKQIEEEANEYKATLNANLQAVQKEKKGSTGNSNSKGKEAK